MDNIFAQAQELHLLRPLDIHFAYMLALPNERALMLASACVSADAGIGHVCLPIRLLMPTHLFGGCYPQLAQKAWEFAGSPLLSEWPDLLLASPAVSNGSRPSPLVLNNQCIYLHRMWRNECIVAEFFNLLRPPILVDEVRVSQVLEQFFPTHTNQIDWQKIAAAVAITHPVALITGGPGTGKTFTVAKLLAALLLLNDDVRLHIIMAAPTGKAAARLSESLRQALLYLNLDKNQQQRLPQEALTLHRLLGAQPNSQRMLYNQNNQLHVDILIIDEASMIDLSMMANLITALPPQVRIIFLGDRCQLSSVEAGAVLGDICKFAEAGYSARRHKQLVRLTGYVLPISSNHAGSHKVADSLCLLRNNYRFDGSSSIGRLANAINTGDIKETRKLLNIKPNKNIHYVSLHKNKEYEQMLAESVTSYRGYLVHVINGEKPAIILQAFNSYRLLCALREGPFGVTGLNSRIEQELSRAGLIYRPINRHSNNYAGRPVMIIRNTPSLGLYNGDIGIILPDQQQILRAHFLLSNGNIKAIPLSRLPEHETAFVMTVRKSQGSEFTHVTLVLPNKSLPVLTRELLYTAVTRARKQLSLYATDEVLVQAIATPTQRRSGLIQRITNVTIEV